MERGRELAWCVALGLASLCPGTAAADTPAPSEYRLYVGVRHQSELFTANVLTAGRLTLRGVDRIGEEIDVVRAPNVLGAAVRSTELVVVDLPILSYTIVIPHELFGHGARYREFDAEPFPHLDLPLPYSLEANHYVRFHLTRPLYAGEQSVMSLAGLEAQEASQRMLASTTFRSGTLRRGEAMIYASTSATHALQTLRGRDLQDAANLVQPLYRGDPDRYRRMAATALVLDAIDPMFLATVYASAWRWLIRGEAVSEVPSVMTHGARLLATSRTMPVPWGVEHQLHVLAAWPWATFDFGLRTGFGERKSIGVELATFDWRFLQTMRAGGELAFWVQPLVPAEATLGRPSETSFFAVGDDIRDRTTTGGAVRLLVEIDRPRWFLGTRLGWKSEGLWGERELEKGFEAAMTGGLKLQ